MSSITKPVSGGGSDTAAQILTKLKTVDGAGSGLDADLLDGANAGAGDALTSGKLSQFAATTSLELKGVITDETGSGALAFATSPTFVTPILGTPTSGTLTNCTLPVGGITGLGTGVETLLATPTSANLATAITDETGSGALVFANTPTLVTPVLGVATATSVNKVAVTAPATSATLTIADGATLTVSASATVSNGTHSGTNTGDQTNITGNAATVTTNADLTGDVTSTGNATTIGAGKVTNAMMATAAKIPWSHSVHWAGAAMSQAGGAIYVAGHATASPVIGVFVERAVKLDGVSITAACSAAANSPTVRCRIFKNVAGIATTSSIAFEATSGVIASGSGLTWADTSVDNATMDDYDGVDDVFSIVFDLPVATSTATLLFVEVRVWGHVVA